MLFFKRQKVIKRFSVVAATHNSLPSKASVTGGGAAIHSSGCESPSLTKEILSQFFVLLVSKYLEMGSRQDSGVRLVGLLPVFSPILLLFFVLSPIAHLLAERINTFPRVLCRFKLSDSSSFGHSFNELFLYPYLHLTPKT